MCAISSSSGLAFDGPRPASISNMITPNEYTSARPSTSALPQACSGAI
jgi:hypothetical protein